MGRSQKAPKFARMKKMITSKAIKQHKEEVLNPKRKDLSLEKLPRNVPQVSSALFFSYNTALGPPYRVLVDTNFINFSIQNKLDLQKAMLDCLYAKCTPCITDCVMAELEKLGQKYRVASRIAKDPRFERVPCAHKGTYADDCIVERVTKAQILRLYLWPTLHVDCCFLKIVTTLDISPPPLQTKLDAISQLFAKLNLPGR